MIPQRDNVMTLGGKQKCHKHEGCVDFVDQEARPCRTRFQAKSAICVRTSIVRCDTRQCVTRRAFARRCRTNRL